MRKSTKILLSLIAVVGLVIGGKFVYDNYFASTDSNYKKLSDDKLSDNQKRIRNMVMHDNTNGMYKKQGFVAIPDRQILLPIYDNAWDDNGLNPGASRADLTNKIVEGSSKKQMINGALEYYQLSDASQLNPPDMGNGNYVLAAHNFGVDLRAEGQPDVWAGFTNMQVNPSSQAPYVIDGQYRDNIDALNGVKIYMIDDKGLYEYTIRKQKSSDTNDATPMNPTLRSNGEPMLTIISCIAPNINTDRLVTVSELTNSWRLDKAPDDLLSIFDLTQKNTNARATGWSDQQRFPGLGPEHPNVENKTWNLQEEGANGNAGGTK